MISCFQFSFNVAFNFNLRRYTKGGKKVSAESIKFLAREEGSAAPVAVALHPSCVVGRCRLTI